MAHPIVLAHGIARFDVLIAKTKYWSDIPDILASKQYKVHQTNVDWAGSVAKRAKQFAQQVKSLKYQKVNVIAHSSGGLDVRYAIVKNGLAPYVASLTTLCTPHHGSSFADWAFEEGVADRIIPIFEGLGIDMSGFKDLTTEACKARNKEMEKFEEKNEHNIRYQTYAGVQGMWDVFWPLLPSYRIIKEREGFNDGLASVSSAKWKDKYFKGIRDWDHLNFLGWWELAELDIFGGGRTEKAFKKEIREFYLSLAQSLP